MPIVAKLSSNFSPPPEGPQQAVCVDVVDLGLVEQTWGEEKKLKPMVRLVWHSAEIDDSNPSKPHPFTIMNRYTLSLDEKANLRKHLEAWRGRAFTEEELDGFDLESLIGANAFIQIVHKKVGGKTYGNIASIMKLPKGMPTLPITPGFVRKQDRVEATPPDDHHDAPPPDDDDIPF